MRIRLRPVTTPLPLPSTSPETVWFGPRCCVVSKGETRDILVGGMLIGSFGLRDIAARNVLLVGLAADPQVHLGKLARGVGMSSEALRQLRREYEKGGVEALVERKHGGNRRKPLPGAVQRKLEKQFERGVSVAEAFAAVPAAGSAMTVWRLRQRWEAARAEAPRSESVTEALVPASTSQGESATSEALPQSDGPATDKPATPGAVAAEPPAAPEVTPSEEKGLQPRPPESAAHVQHAGAWLLISMANALGLYWGARAAAGRRVGHDALRLALDAMVAALAVGERCVEGVRRLATSSAAALLMAGGAPSTTWVRRTLGQFAAYGGGPLFQLQMAHEYLARAREEGSSDGAVFYVDNHLRPYTGQHKLRQGWRMQDKRARPGTSDYYVHDEDGRPVFHYVAPEHGSLTSVLTPAARFLREALGPKERLLLAFDRAGSFPEQMAELRDEGVDFVAYERRPYAPLPKKHFTQAVILRGERLQLHESRANLGAGRGRVRRVSVLTPEGAQVNVLAVSTLPARRLLEALFGRWAQENALKHANERWGLNHLDGRTVKPYQPDTIIPNPARRRLDTALQLARAREGVARNELARLHEGDAHRADVEAQLEEILEEQHELEALRPTTPTHAELKDTELADKLVQHTVEYKLVLDTIRAACANAESELAAVLAPHLPRGAEAKKALANLFAAPGRISVNRRSITVTLSPAGTPSEQRAFAAMFEELNARRLVMPADQARRSLRFAVAQVS